MSIQYMENFQSYGDADTPSDSDLLDGTPWISLGDAVNTDRIVTNPDGTDRVFRVLGGSISGATNTARLALPSPSAVVGVGFRIYLTRLPENLLERPAVYFMNGSNQRIARLTIEPNGAMKLSRYASNYSTETQVAATSVPVIAASSWFHFELRINNSTGGMEVRREGTTIADLTVAGSGALNEATTSIIGFASVHPGSGSAPFNMYIKDLVVWDNQGSQNNSFIGPVSVTLLSVVSDVSSGWTSTGANAFSVLDETTPNDADYVSADDSPPAPVIMELSDLSGDIVAVRALQTMVRAKKSDGGDANLQVSLISGVAEDNGGNNPITTGYKYWMDISELDPATATAWSPISVNAARIKLDRTV